ncbi:MLF1 factor, partial [Atrichornis clamosus]|nr:MLF1 factor [Atrichornis clamosus]
LGITPGDWPVESLFCRDPIAAHHEQMQQMMRSFSEPFGRDPFLSLPEGRERPAERRGHRDSQVARGSRRVNFGDPFCSMDKMMSNMRNNVLEMQRKFDDLSIHPEGHTFSSSSVMSYSKVGDEAPKVFQASAQTRTAPGGVKETRKAFKDSESGVEKMSIGHHLQDRAHVIKKSRNARTGDEEMNQEFINLDETEAESFDEEWQKEIMKFRPCRSRDPVKPPRSRSVHYRKSLLFHGDCADCCSFSREKPLGAPGSRMPRDSLETLNVKGTHVPLKSCRK